MARQSNVELCRILSIVLVILVHTTFQSLGADCSSLGILILAAFSIIGVNVFVLITGYFSAEPKKSSLANLLFICFFWMIFKIGVIFAGGGDIGWKDCFFVTRSNWFIPSYLCLLFITPMLNAFCNSASKMVLLGVTLALFFCEIWFDLLPPHPSVLLGSQRGYSVLSFIALYLLARFFRLYGVPHLFRKWSFLIYLLCSILLSVSAFLSIKSGHPQTRILYAYSNPIVILSALSFFVTFEKIQMGENCVINHIAKSTLSVLLGQSAIFVLFTKQFKYLYDSFDGIVIVLYWALAVIVVFMSSVLLDQFRQFLWAPIGGWLKKNIKTDRVFQ